MKEQKKGALRSPRAALSSPILTLALAVGFALVFYNSNTPAGYSVSSDNAMYLTMGTAIARGYAPYTEIFDHKGPLLFLLQALPQAIAGGYSLTAVWLLEVAFLFGTLRLIEHAARRMGAPALSAQLFYLALTGVIANGGNLTEEYANFFTAAGIVLLVRCFGGEGERKRLLPEAAALGAAAMAAFLLRANNVLPLMAAALAVAAGLALSGRLREVGVCAAGLILGCAAVLLPVALWLASRGALGAAVYGALIHNMKYAETGTTGRFHTLLTTPYGWAALTIAAFSCAGALALFLRRGKHLLPAAMVAGAMAAGFAAFISRKFYLHYLLLGAPMAAFGAAAALGCLRGTGRARAVRIAAAAICLVALVPQGLYQNAWRVSERGDWEQFCADANALYSKVPEEERDRFMAYRVEPKWYVATGALPCMRFYFLQEILGQADPAVMDEIAETFAKSPPEWLVIYYERAFSPPYDERVAKIFEEDYAFVCAAGEYQLLRRAAP